MADNGVVQAHKYNTALLRLGLIGGTVFLLVGAIWASDPVGAVGWAIYGTGVYTVMTMLLGRTFDRRLRKQLHRITADQLPPPASVSSAMVQAALILVILYAVLVGLYLAVRPNPGVLLGFSLFNPITAYYQRRRLDRVEREHHATAYVSTKVAWTPSQARKTIIWLVPQPDVTAVS
ncbi:MAG: hypothetical protein M3Y91_02890 [Actinomycetota bacterium]|nr:hypothetical protein [Actinomycetota bacterium]